MINSGKRYIRHHLLLIIIGFLVIYFVFYKFANDSKSLQTRIANTKDDLYPASCLELFKKLRYPNQSLIFNPALKQPPADMMDEFTQYGEMPITRWFYINEVYNDSLSSEAEETPIISAKNFKEIRIKVKNNGLFAYEDKALNNLMRTFLLNKVKCQSFAVIGTQIPWVEAMGLEYGCENIVTLDYTRKKYEYPKMKWYHVNDYLDYSIKTRAIEQFDAIASFSSLEHSGLGRYGDPLDPNGDITAVRQIYCMLKPGGLFFLGLPTSLNGSSYIEFNAHRVYGTARLRLLLKGWTILDQARDLGSSHTTFVLKKPTNTL